MPLKEIEYCRLGTGKQHLSLASWKSLAIVRSQAQTIKENLKELPMKKIRRFAI